MTEDVIFFDTGACMDSEFRGKANQIYAESISQRYDKVTKNITAADEAAAKAAAEAAA